MARRDKARPQLRKCVAALRDRMLTGVWRAGEQIPNQIDLAQQTGFSINTVQTALTELARQGVIDVRARQGRFVSELPPHHTDFAVVFLNSPKPAPDGHSEWSRYYEAIRHAAMALEDGRSRRIHFFYGLHTVSGNPDYERLLELVTEHRLAGMLFANFPAHLLGTPLLDEPGLARVCLGDRTYPGVVPAAMGVDCEWLRKAAVRLAAAARQRVAIISYRALLAPSQQAEMESVFAAHGLVVPDYWRQPLDPYDPIAVRHYVKLLMRAPAEERPDALIIGDDNLVEQALRGLLESGVRVPDDLLVIAHANFPNVPTRVVPVEYLGYDIEELLRLCFARLQGAPEATTSVAPIHLEARFEWAVTGRARPATTENGKA